MTSVVAEVRRWKELVAEAKKVATAAVGAQLDKATVHLDAIAAEIAKLATALGGPDPTDAIDQGLEAIEASLTAVGGDLTAIIDLLSKPFPAAADVARRLRDAARFFQKANERFGKTLGVALRGHAMAQDLARNQTVRLSWSTQLEKWPSDHPVFDGRNGGPAPRLLLEGELRGKAAHGKPAGVDLVAQIDAFDLNLVGKARLLILHFDKIAFRLLAGKKPDLDVVFGDVEFTGPLTFVQTLRKVIPLDGFSDPPALDVSPKGITGSFSIALPNLAVGVFSLQNLSLSAGFTIPFIGDTPLTVRFGFCSREQPFVLTVSMLGGGGFFAIAISPNGIETMEAALEFGACLAVDLGVASGSVSIMAGVYFKKEKGDVTLTGYLRVRGEVQVLGMISASLELYMSLTYEGASGSVIGKASLEITVKVLFFSASVKVEMEKRFKGGNADPTFLELMAGPPANPLATWNEYRAAFAAAA